MQWSIGVGPKFRYRYETSEYDAVRVECDAQLSVSTGLESHPESQESLESLTANVCELKTTREELAFVHPLQPRDSCLTTYFDQPMRYILKCNS